MTPRRRTHRTTSRSGALPATRQVLSILYTTTHTPTRRADIRRRCRAVEGGGVILHEGPVAVAVGPVPPFGGVVHQAGCGQYVGQQGAVRTGLAADVGRGEEAGAVA